MPSSGNLILDSFSASLRDAILIEARQCHLPLRTVLLRRGTVPANLVFPTSGMMSLVVMLSNGSTSEVGMLGCESITGISTLLAAIPSNAECIVQIHGDGLQVPRRHLLGLFHSSEEFRESMLRLAQCQMNVSLQLAACNLGHQAEARFARWLLTAADRTGSGKLAMTQEFIAGMIATRRTTVSLIVGALSERNLIKQRRGTIQIVDRPGLTDAACECYELCRRWTYPSSLEVDTDAACMSPQTGPPDDQLTVRSLFRLTCPACGAHQDVTDGKAINALTAWTCSQCSTARRLVVSTPPLQ